MQTSCFCVPPVLGPPRGLRIEWRAPAAPSLSPHWRDPQRGPCPQPLCRSRHRAGERSFRQSLWRRRPLRTAAGTLVPSPCRGCRVTLSADAKHRSSVRYLLSVLALSSISSERPPAAPILHRPSGTVSGRAVPLPKMTMRTLPPQRCAENFTTTRTGPSDQLPYGIRRSSHRDEGKHKARQQGAQDPDGHERGTKRHEDKRNNPPYRSIPEFLVVEPRLGVELAIIHDFPNRYHVTTAPISNKMPATRRKTFDIGVLCLLRPPNQR